MRLSWRRGDPHVNRTGVLTGNFEKRNPQERYQDPVLWVWLGIVFIPKKC